MTTIFRKILAIVIFLAIFVAMFAGCEFSLPGENPNAPVENPTKSSEDSLESEENPTNPEEIQPSSTAEPTQPPTEDDSLAELQGEWGNVPRLRINGNTGVYSLIHKMEPPYDNFNASYAALDGAAAENLAAISLGLIEPGYKLLEDITPIPGEPNKFSCKLNCWVVTSYTNYIDPNYYLDGFTMREFKAWTVTREAIIDLSPDLLMISFKNVEDGILTGSWSLDNLTGGVVVTELPLFGHGGYWNTAKFYGDLDLSLYDILD